MNGRHVIARLAGAGLCAFAFALAGAGAAPAQPAAALAASASATVDARAPAAASASASASAPRPALLPLASFFAPPKLQHVALSPSGRWLAALTTVADRRAGVLMIDVEGREPTRFVQPAVDEVAWFTWVSDDWLVFSVRDLRNGVQRHWVSRGDGVMAMKRDGSASRQIVGRGDNDAMPGALPIDHFYMGLGAAGSDEVIIGQVHWDAAGEYMRTSLKAVNVATGARRRLQEDGPRATGWLLDANGVARVATIDDDTHTSVLWADTAGAWRQIARFALFEPAFIPMFVQGADNLVVSVPDANGDLELRRFDFAAGRSGTEVLLSTPGFDGDVSVVRERGSGRIQAYRTTLDASTTVWLSATMRDIQAKADAKFPGSINLLQCSPCDKPSVVLVFSYADTDPGSFVLYRPLLDQWQLIGQARPDIDPRRMATLRFHRTKARDGRDLPVWVTLPPTALGGAQPAAGHAAPAPAQPLPAVVLVHGGPHMRGTSWQWNGEAQFLASRGYAVIEPEFRGSTGYGDKHFRAGWKQWGLAMQDDITDALRFAVAQGWADPQRVCIMGSSFGGYAALMGVAKDPDQYRCAVAHAAVADPRFMFDFHWSDASAFNRRAAMPVLLGDRKKDDAQLAAGSPLEQVQGIKAPVLLVHGGADRRVPVDNGERMRDALRKHGKTVEWVLYDDEGHGFAGIENELDYYRRVEAFLGKYLKP